MKNVIMIALALFTLQLSAQKKEHKHNHATQHNKRNISPEDMATLQTKKMTLALDLTTGQQTKVKALMLENAKKRKDMMVARKSNKENNENKKLTQKQRLQIANTRLDNKIATKAKMKAILDKDQYSKYEKLQQRMAMKHKKRGRKKSK